MATHAPWYLGLTVDHLYEQCPGRQRSLPELQRAGWDGPGRAAIDPLGTDICGWCRRVWLARNPQPAGADDSTGSCDWCDPARVITVELPGVSR